ncbi:MAG: hypothetical protein EP326_03050 [Deltaproteobacteria bacterium]|nr:MAG: hypothetical protein EP326_03050 [Deltaproteobacteria bacterium]TNF30305.1 MAG: hypothetical protein EP319_05525 [Deltaproteobacteria bacterium]
MKKFFIWILFIPFIAASAGVGDWKIVGEEGDFWLQSTTDSKTKNLITKRTGESKVISTKDVGEDHEIIVYYTGMAGTFKLVDIYYAQIFNKKTKKFLGDYPWEYKSQNNPDEKLPQPKWEIGTKSISISDEQTTIQKVIQLN